MCVTETDCKVPLVLLTSEAVLLQELQLGVFLATLAVFQPLVLLTPEAALLQELELGVFLVTLAVFQSISTDFGDPYIVWGDLETQRDMKDTYQMQGEGEKQTNIVGKDLSFQDQESTREVWDEILKEVFTLIQAQRKSKECDANRLV